MYSRVHTCNGAEATLSVGRSCAPSPLRAVTRTVYLLPGSRALWGERTGWSRAMCPALWPDCLWLFQSRGVRLWTVSSWWPRRPPGGQICGLRPGCSLVGSCSLSVQSRVREGTGLCRALGIARRLVFRQGRGPWLEFSGGAPVPHECEGLAEPNVCAKCGSHRAVASSWEPGLFPRTSRGRL